MSVGRIALRIVVVGFAFVVLLGGCATLMSRNPVPRALVNDAHIANIDNVRIWGDAVPKGIDEAVARKVAFIEARRSRELRAQEPLQLNFLALSGGADKGAFGAGLLSGWSKTGGRPEFDVVTGVSTGALMAPFVFIGPAYDQQLREIYTHYTTDDLLIQTPLVGLLGGPSLADPTPLADLIAKYVDRRLLRLIAREHAKGRVLFVTTTNLDAQRPVMWNMGLIASSRHPKALALFRKILLAAVSIPGAFPPVHIEVVADGEHYDEMHVDGGTTSEVFLLPTQLMLSSVNNHLLRNSKRRLFIIMNGKIAPEWKPVEASMFTVSERSLSTLFKNQGIGDLTKLYLAALRDGMDYNLAAIPGTFDKEKSEYFDRDYMRALFDLGFLLGHNGYKWAKLPPGLRNSPGH